MKDEQKTKAELIKELKILRRQNGLQKSNSAEINKNPVSNNNEEFNRAVVESSPLGISVRSSSGKLLSVNNAWKKIWSFSDEQVKELMKADPVDPSFLNNRESLGEWLPKVENIYKNGGFLHIPKLFLTDKQCDRSCWVSLTYYAINDDKGDVDRIVILTDDITERKQAEDKLKKSQKLYQTLVENIDLGITLIDSNYNILMSNEAQGRLFNKSFSELTGKKCYKEFEKCNDVCSHCPGSIVMTTGQTAKVQTQRIKDDGSKFDVRINVFPIFDNDSKPTGFIEVVEDITEHKLAEDEVRKFKTISDMANYGTAIVDLQGNIIYLNDYFASMHGLTIEETIGKHLSIFHTDEQLPEIVRINKNLIKNGSYPAIEVWHKRKDGTVFPTMMNATIIKDENDKSLYISASAIDVTDHKQAEEALKDSQQRLQGLSDASFEAIFLSDKGICIDQNITAEKIFGYTSQEAIGRPGTDWIVPEDRELVKNKMISGCEKPYDVTALRKDGTTFPAEIQGRMIEYRGNPVRVTSLRDITVRKHAEKNLQGYERIVSSSNDMLALLDKNFVYLAVNERYAKAFGMTRGELVGSTVSKIFGKEFFESVIQPYAEKCMQGHEIRYQDWFDFPTYGKRSMEIAYDPFRGPDNEINGFVVNGRDITDRKQAEEALRESQEHYKNFFENALVGFFRTKISDGTFIEINSKAAEQLGLPIEKIIGKMRSADLYRNADQRKELLTILKRDGVVHDFETDMTLLDGRNIIFSISAKAYPEQDYLEGTVVDITERKQTEEELRKLAEVVKYSSELVNMADLDGNMIFLNKAGGEMLGIDPDNVQDTNIMEVIPEKWKNIVQNELLPALMSGEHWNGELQYRNIKTGKLTDVHAMAFTVKDPKTGKPQFLANVSLDITETKRLREQESRALRLESAGRVAGQIAHDFNNLLAPLVAYPDFIKEGLPENHPTLKYINGMEKSANQIAEINQQLLTLSRRGHYNQEVLNLNEVIQFAIGEMGILPQTAVIETDFAKNLMNIRGGASQINRILFNLIHNARDAMQDVGNIIIKTENYYADNPTTNFGHIPKGEYVKITISDIGCGIPEDIKHNIFDPFYTTKSSDRRRGSGLGLSVVDAVMKDHDGYIDLQSSVGDGTSFYLYFPITRETIDAACEEEILGGTESILVVDDDKTQCDVALMLLNKLGYNATAINSGEQAIQYIKKNPQDLLLLDMIMPDGIDGTETFRQVIEMYPNQRAIIVSGYAESSRVEEARQLGIEMYIRKPLTLKLVASCIRKVLDKKEDLVSIS